MDYLRLSYYKAPKFILSVIGNYIYFVGHLFSVSILLRTLFSPWKREIAKKEKQGISLGDFLNVFSFNIISRSIGFVIRVSTLIVALLAFISVFLIGFCFLIIWLLVPIFSLLFYFKKNSTDDTKKNIFIKSHLAESSKTEEALEVTKWYERYKQKEISKSQFWTRENLSSIPGIAQNWAYGYTPVLNNLTLDLSREPFDLDKFVGRKNQISEIERVLIKEGNNNVVLVGEPGVGRRTTVIGLAKLIDSGKSLVLYKKVLMLDLNLILSKDLAETKQKLMEVLDEASKAGNVILVVPSFDQFVSAGDSRINLTDVFSEQIASKKLQIIGIVDTSSYEKYISSNQTIMKLFEKVEILEISKDETIEILENLAIDLEKKYKLTISYGALKEIVKQSGDLVTDVPFPGKAIDLLEELCVYIQNQKENTLLPSAVDELLSEKTKLPIGELKEAEKAKLKDLEAILHKRIVGQEIAIQKISEALRRKRTGLESKNSPIGAFLFVGPTGVGKTETAKALAEFYFGSENKMVRLDMSEFQSENDITKLIGDQNTPGILVSKISENPFTVLLLDEFEKANSKIINLFLTVLDEGYITDGRGKIVSFKNCVVIATSNAGSEFIREELEKAQPPDNLENLLTEYLLKEKIFSPELLNRFDSVVFYKPLTKAQLIQIAGLIIGKINKKLEEEKGITIVVSASDISKLVDIGYKSVFGARNLERTIEESIENSVADKILEGVQKGSKIELKL